MVPSRTVACRVVSMQEGRHRPQVAPDSAIKVSQIVRRFTTHHKQAFQPRDPVIAEPGQLPMAGSGLTLAAPYSRLTHLAAAGIQLPLLMTKSRRTSLNSLAIYAKSLRRRRRSHRSASRWRSWRVRSQPPCSPRFLLRIRNKHHRDLWEEQNMDTNQNTVPDTPERE